MNVFTVACCRHCQIPLPSNEANAYYGWHEDCYVDRRMNWLTCARLIPIDPIKQIRSEPGYGKSRSTKYKERLKGNN